MIVLGMMPVSLFVYADTSTETEEITYGTPGEDYEAGEVIVCVKGGTKALAESGIFDRKLMASASKNEKTDASNYDGLQGSLASTAIIVKETLISFDAGEAQIDRIAATDDSEYAEALRDEYAEKNSKKKMLKSSGNEDDYSLVLVKSRKPDVTDLIAALEKLSCVKFAEPNAICTTESYNPTDATNEPLYKYQWYSDSSQSTKGIDVKATETYGNSGFSSQKEVVVAIMDSGVDYTHPDLVNSMWDQGDTKTELTDLGGGKYGINTSGDGSTTDPMDTIIGHGTHCASTIASTWANNEGIAGINGNTKIMACRWMAKTGVTSNFVKAMKYVIKAREAGVNVVATNNSWGPGLSTGYVGKSTELVVEEAAEKGIVSCFAAGNSGLDHDRFTNQSYSSPYCLVVGAMDSTGKPAWFSDRGVSTVDVFSPGTQILAATSLQPTVSSTEGMVAQYLPWIQNSEDSFFYEDFEDFSNKKITLSSYKYDPDTNVKSNIKTDETNASGYLSNNSCKVSIDGEIAVGDNLGIELNIPLDKILNGAEKLPESDSYYMAFQAGVDNYDFANNGSNHIAAIEYCSKNDDKEQWNIIGTDISFVAWRCIDGNWSISSKAITPEQMNALVDAAKTTDNVLKLRIASEVTSIDSGADFYIDSFGLGTKNSKYYYSDGTSMATPVATAVASLIAGAGASLPDSGEDVLELIAKVKGGVDRDNTSLSAVCVTKGCVQADTAYKSDSELNPVPDTVVLNGDGKATISGHFFGNTNGTVKVNGIEATVNSWSDKEIKIDIPTETEYGLIEYSVTRADNKSGRDFGLFVDKQSGSDKYQDLGIGDFTYGDIKTKDMLPMRIAANEDGVMALLVDANNTEVGLEFYSFGSKTWSQIQQPEGIKIQAFNMECNFSLVGGKDQFYLLCTEADGSIYLLTYSTSENKWLYKVKLGGNHGAGEFLGLDKNGKLCIGGGVYSSAEPDISQIYPDTGFCSETHTTLPEDYQGLSGGDYLISGDMQILAGINLGSTGRSMESITHEIGSPVENPAILSDGEWKIQNTPFYSTDAPSEDGSGNAGLDHQQMYIAAYGALDSGFIMTGPARDIGKTTMVDTWIYDAGSDKYKALDARVDAMRLKMQAGVCRNGKFYVMGQSVVTGETFFKCLDLSEYDVTTTDNSVNAKLEATNPCVTALGTTWLNDDDGNGYYIKDEEGHLTKDGANQANYEVAFDSEKNKITLRNADICDMQNSRSADERCAIYSKKDLNLELVGDNKVSIPYVEEFFVPVSIIGVYCKGDINIFGSGSLDVKSGTRARNNYAIYSEKTVNFNSTGEINCTGQLGTVNALKVLVQDKIAAYGVVAKEDVNINSGKVTITAESVTPVFSTTLSPKAALHESVGIDANEAKVSGNAELTVRSGDVTAFKEKISAPDAVTLSSEGDSPYWKMNSIAIRTKKPAEIGSSKVTTYVGKLSDYDNGEIVSDGTYGNLNRGFSQAPVLTKDVTAKVWYGKDKSSADAAGAQQFSKLSSNLTEKYIHIEAADIGGGSDPIKTGDSNEIAFYILLTILALIGIGTSYIFEKK